MASFKDLKIPDGLKELNDHLLTRSYIEGSGEFSQYAARSQSSEPLNSYLVRALIGQVSGVAR